MYSIRKLQANSAQTHTQTNNGQHVVEHGISTNALNHNRFVNNILLP